MTAKQPLGIFIIYAREDETYRHELVKHLRPMEREGIVWIWTDRELLAGEEWEPKIKEKLQSADLVLLLISADYFSSNYIHEVEIKEALIRHQSGEARVIPIIIRPCDWEFDQIVGKIQVLPSDSIAVGTWPNYEDAWVDVVKGIRRIIEQTEIEKSERELERRDKIVRERLAAEEAERKKLESLARKKREQLKKVERERLAAEKEELRKEAWKNLLEFPTIKGYQDYLQSYPKPSFQDKIDNYPALALIQKALIYQSDLSKIGGEIKKYISLMVLCALPFAILENILNNLDFGQYIKDLLYLPIVILGIKTVGFFIEWLDSFFRLKVTKSTYKKKIGSRLQ